MDMVLGPNDSASKSGEGGMTMNKQRRTWIRMAAIACFLLGAQMAVLGQTYQAYHDSVGYTSPGFVTVNCQFDYTNTNAFDFFGWMAVLPEGWAVTAVSGGGYESWDIFLWQGDYYLSPNGAPPQNSTTVSFSYTISVPEGQTGEKTIRGEAEYWFRRMLDPKLCLGESRSAGVEQSEQDTSDHLAVRHGYAACRGVHEFGWHCLAA